MKRLEEWVSAGDRRNEVHGVTSDMRKFFVLLTENNAAVALEVASDLESAINAAIDAAEGDRE